MLSTIKSVPKTLVLFTVAYMAPAAFFAVSTSNREFIFYIAVMAAMISAVMAVHARARLSDGLLWTLTVWGLMHMAGGLVPVPKSWPYNGEINVLYSLWIIPEKLKYDHVVHFYGFATTTWLCWQALRNGVRDNFNLELKPTIGLMTLCAAGGMGFGAINEIVEFVATLAIPETNVGGYVNTGWDLVSNAFGTIFAATLIYFLEGASSPDLESASDE